MMSLGIDQHAHQLTISLRDESGDVIQARQDVVTCKRASMEINSYEGGFVPSFETRVVWQSVRPRTAPRVSVVRRPPPVARTSELGRVWIRQGSQLLAMCFAYASGCDYFTWIAGGRARSLPGGFAVIPWRTSMIWSY